LNLGIALRYSSDPLTTLILAHQYRLTNRKRAVHSEFGYFPDENRGVQGLSKIFPQWELEGRSLARESQSPIAPTDSVTAKAIAQALLLFRSQRISLTRQAEGVV
jgi:hypothetical protein